MKLSDNIYVLKLPSTMNPEQFIYPTIISNEENLLLIDTGNPGQIEDLKEAFIKEGLNFNNLKAIVLTHQDIDHVGTLKDIINDVKDIKVYSSVVEEKYINGSETPTKLAYLEKNLSNLPEQAKFLYEKMKNFYQCNKTNIDTTLKEGDSIPNFEDVVVIDTPGHTPGHISLYERKSKTLIVGDAFILKDGILSFTDSNLNYDDTMYLNSLKHLCNYDIDTAICYHGSVYDNNFNKEIRNLINKNI